MSDNKDTANPSSEQKSEEKTDDVDKVSSDLEAVLQESSGDKTADDLNDTAKSRDDDEKEHSDDEDEDTINAGETAEKAKSLHIKMSGFKRCPVLEDELKALYTFFTKGAEVEAPLIQIPGPEDKWIYFELKSNEDKTKVIKFARKGAYEGQKLIAKPVTIKQPYTPVIQKMSVEEGLNLLFPHKDVLYAEQLKKKAELAKSAFDKIIPKESLGKYIKSKKLLKNVRMRESLPMYPIDGYESGVSIAVEVDSETGNTVYGVRAVTENKEASVIIPLDLCPSIPQQIKILGKKLIEALPKAGLEPYNYETKEGDVVAVAVRMTAFGSFLVTVMVPKIVALTFKQLTAEGVVLTEGEKPEDSYVMLVKKKTEELKEKLTKFFSGDGKDLCIESIFLLMVHPNNLLASRDETTRLTTHVAGQKFLPERLNGVSIRITWEREGHLEVLKPLLSVIEAHGNISSTSRIYLASPHRLLGLYFAKRCAHVTMFFFWTKEMVSELTQWAKQLGITNIDFQSAKLSPKKKLPKENVVAIFWNFSKPFVLERFVDSDIQNIMVISNWNKDVPDKYVENLKKVLENAYSKLKISSMFPFDSSPHKDKFKLVVFFQGSLKQGENHRAAGAVANKANIGAGGPIRSRMRGSGVRGIPYSRGQDLARARERAQVSAFDRLGPRDPYAPRGYDDSWGGRPDPWAGGSSSQPQPSAPVSGTLKRLDEVATGVMQNLQAVQQHMNAFIQNSNSRGVAATDSAGWSNKRKYSNDYPEQEGLYDRWGSGQGPRDDPQYGAYDDRSAKRRRELTPDRSADSGRWGGNNSWREQPNLRSSYGEHERVSESWNEVNPPDYYEKGRSANNSWNSPNPQSSWAAGSNPSSVWKSGASWNGKDAPRSYY